MSTEEWGNLGELVERYADNMNAVWEVEGLGKVTFIKVNVWPNMDITYFIHKWSRDVTLKQLTNDDMLGKLSDACECRVSFKNHKNHGNRYPLIIVHHRQEGEDK